MPGGNVELGEPLDKAICREFLEETGIVIKPIGPRQRSRLLDAMNAKILVPFEAWEANPD
jgi:8-oxo-dGTP pyrophosphatase MutT (NUDIX family)